jgi:hypothetical protein
MAPWAQVSNKAGRTSVCRLDWPGTVSAPSTRVSNSAGRASVRRLDWPESRQRSRPSGVPAHKEYWLRWRAATGLGV